MPIGVFLSHNHADKPFVRQLANDLESHGLAYWLDEAEIKVGESLVQKIREGIDILTVQASNLAPVDRPLDTAIFFNSVAFIFSWGVPDRSPLTIDMITDTNQPELFQLTIDHQKQIIGKATRYHSDIVILRK